MSNLEEDYSVLSHLVISKPLDTLSQRLLENSFKAYEKKKLGAAFFIVNCTVTCCSLTNSGTSPPEF